MSGIHDAYAARKAVDVMNDTWGHLKPKDRTYSGFILYTQGVFGDVAVIDYDFNGLTASPWLYEDIHDFIGGNGEEDGKIHLWQGSYRRTRLSKKFVGAFKVMSADALFQQMKNRVGE